MCDTLNHQLTPLFTLCTATPFYSATLPFISSTFILLCRHWPLDPFSSATKSLKYAKSSLIGVSDFDASCFILVQFLSWELELEGNCDMDNWNFLINAPSKSHLPALESDDCRQTQGYHELFQTIVKGCCRTVTGNHRLTKHSVRNILFCFYIIQNDLEVSLWWCVCSQYSL